MNQVQTRAARLINSDPVLTAFAEEVGAAGPVVIVGNRTRWATGGSPAADAREISAPTGIVGYQPEEMTVTVRAGTPVAELHAALAEAGQRSALPERGGTVGGAFAVGENGLFPLGRGRLRTALLQVRYVSAEGKLITGGGPTVKNVTGFDLPRLMVGSLGTLGCLAECIIRTNPIPGDARWLTSVDVDPFAIAATVLRPSVTLWDGSQTWVLLEGHPAAVDSEAAKLHALASFVDADGPPPRPAHRWSLAPAALASADALPPGPFVASIGVGTVWADSAQPEKAVDPTVRMLTERMKQQFDPTGRLNPGRSVL